MNFNNPFASFLMGGFECSTHRRGDDRRIDVIAASRHDEFARQDYQRLSEIGMLTARDGIRWHLIERKPYEYDFSSALGQIRAARETNLQIIWDLFHYGFPVDLDLMSDEFVERFAAFAAAFTRLLIDEGISHPLFCPVNEISFFAWITGAVGWWYPFLRGRGDDVKRQLVKAAIGAAQKIKEIAPEAVVIQTDPLVNVVASRGNPANAVHARNMHDAQYHALDIIMGKREPELGGSLGLVDIIGVNFYSDNQWRHPSGRRLQPGDARYRPFRQMLREIYERHRTPLFVAETGIENEARPAWLRFVCAEVAAAIDDGVPVLGICLYPIVNHPGWDDDRHCHNGLWDYADASGHRPIYEPLAAEIQRQMRFFEEKSLKKTNSPISPTNNYDDRIAT